ncbi:MAG: retropepsin-like domain-containing protein [Lachnospiraceae bacterium]|nr:retropepsin-like domain-containing protein [Lachnospiraceae bacterium]
MTKLGIHAKKQKGVPGYWIVAKSGSLGVQLKFDTGAINTVISSEVYYGSISDDVQKKIVSSLDLRKVKKKEFTSASGGTFVGYLVSANNFRMGDVIIPAFRYYMIIENKRTVALLGEDFIDACRYEHDSYGDVVIHEIDEKYFEDSEGTISEEDMISVIDEILAE